MIFVWLLTALKAVLRLLIPPPNARFRIDPNMPCPACGNVGSTLKFERAVLNGTSGSCFNCGSLALAKSGADIACNQCGVKLMSAGLGVPAAVVRKSCSHCQFAHYERPISAPRWPAV